MRPKVRSRSGFFSVGIASDCCFPPGAHSWCFGTHSDLDYNTHHAHWLASNIDPLIRGERAQRRSPLTQNYSAVAARNLQLETPDNFACYARGELCQHTQYLVIHLGTIVASYPHSYVIPKDTKLFRRSTLGTASLCSLVINYSLEALPVVKITFAQIC